MRYVICGAYIGTQRPTSKAALRAALRACPHSVRFDRVNAPEGGCIRGDQIPEGQVLNVLMPDPWNNRRSYALVSRDSDGKVTVR